MQVAGRHCVYKIFITEMSVIKQYIQQQQTALKKTKFLILEFGQRFAAAIPLCAKLCIHKLGDGLRPNFVQTPVSYIK
jgi:hypothetical protein